MLKIIKMAIACNKNDFSFVPKKKWFVILDMIVLYIHWGMQRHMLPNRYGNNTPNSLTSIFFMYVGDIF